MNKIVTGLLIVIILGGIAGAEVIEISNFNGAEISVTESSPSRTVLSFKLGTFERTPVTIEDVTYFNLKVEGEPALNDKGKPALPYLCRSIIIPDDARMKLNILKSEYIEYESIPIAPSKGHIKRSVDPETVPFTFDEIYSADKWYPSEQSSLREPYILRDLRGTVVEFYPFQYNPSSKTIRVYTILEIEIISEGYGLINVFNRDKPFTHVEPSFKQLYENHFINYNHGALLYDPIPEAGDMLILTKDDYLFKMIPYLRWKRQKGIKTNMYTAVMIGNDTTSIANCIKACYDSTNLAWVILVGDADNIVSPYSSGGSSDVSYAKVAGDDPYPDIFIGRFSAENLENAQTQVERTINYERFPQAGASWYNHAAGVASDLGIGHHGEFDDEHMDFIRDDLLDYNFTSVDRIYDPGAYAQMVTDSLNLGRSFLNYTGHGIITGWTTSNFSNSHVNNLTNDYRLPFIISVACYNGTFAGNTCFAETWLRATNNSNGNPTGAMAVYMSSINQDWTPPMYAQDEAIDLLTTESNLTFGGICYSGACYMIDIDYETGVEHCDTWNIFGDPSVWVTTTTPTPMTVVHNETVIYNATEFLVNTGEEGALCGLYKDGALYGSGYSNAAGQAIVNITRELPLSETLTITVTAPNKLTYEGEVTATTSSGPYVMLDMYTISDYEGNNDGLADCGETIYVEVRLINIGLDPAQYVSAVLKSESDYVTITDSLENFGAISGNFGSIIIAGAYVFVVHQDAPDGHSIVFNLEINNSYIDYWQDSITVTIHAPILEFANCEVNDIGGNGNGILEANETANLIVTVDNNGTSHGYSLNGLLSENDNYISISDPDGLFGNINSGQSGDNSSDYFTVTTSSDFPLGYNAIFNLALTNSDGYAKQFQFVLRPAESFENNNGGYIGQGGWQWGEPTVGPDNAYSGNNVWGTVLDGDYNRLSDDDLISPTFHIYSPEAQLEFYHWYSILNYYDGGNVQISISGDPLWQVITPIGDYPHSNIRSLEGPGYHYSSYNWQNATFNIGAYQGLDVAFRWHFASENNSEGAGWYIDNVSLINNIVEAPVMSYSSDLIEDTLVQEEQQSFDIIISNSGNVNLDFDFATLQEWISLDTTTHSIIPDQSDTMIVILDAELLESGDYNGVITISSNDPEYETVNIPVNLVVTPSYICEYLPGDVNGDARVIGSDISFAVNYFRGMGNVPPDSCYNEQTQNWLYIAADANGDCMFIGSDITFLVNYFRGFGLVPQFCEDLPPTFHVNETMIELKTEKQEYDYIKKQLIR